MCTKVDTAIYPTSLNITIVLNSNKETKFEIVNSVGKTLDVVKVKGNKTINLKKYTTGIYFLRDKSGKLPTKKFSIVK